MLGLLATPKHTNQNTIAQVALTADRLRLYFKDFSKISVQLPVTLNEQRAIADILDTARREIDLLEQIREQIKLQKRGLMQKLLTGEIRVSTDKSVPEEVTS